MKSWVKISVLALIGSVIAISATAQKSPSTLYESLRSALCEQIQMPLIFATRDTAFALSLPPDEPATIYLQLTVGRHGKVKEKQTRVQANHLAQYVTPAFVEAAKGLRIDRALVNKDTSLVVAFSLEYQCIYDTINKAWPDMTPVTIRFSDKVYESSLYGSNSSSAMQARINEGTFYTPDPWGAYRRAKPTRIWFYLAFLKDQTE